MKSNNFKKSKSRPLWYTINHSPVLILGGIEGEKALLITDTNFQDASLVEVSSASQAQTLNGIWGYRTGPQRYANLQQQGMKKNVSARKHKFQIFF